MARTPLGSVLEALLSIPEHPPSTRRNSSTFPALNVGLLELQREDGCFSSVFSYLLIPFIQKKGL